LQDSEQLLSARGSEDEGSGLAVIFRGATLGNFLFTQGKPEVLDSDISEAHRRGE
jgi:hypothetical protein